MWTTRARDVKPSRYGPSASLDSHQNRLIGDSSSETLLKRVRTEVTGTVGALGRMNLVSWKSPPSCQLLTMGVLALGQPIMSESKYRDRDVLSMSTISKAMHDDDGRTVLGQGGKHHRRWHVAEQAGEADAGSHSYAAETASACFPSAAKRNAACVGQHMEHEGKFCDS